MTAASKPTTARRKTAGSPAEVIKRAEEAGVQVVDVRFTDLPGTWQHFSLPLHHMTEDLFTEGIGFDGSSIRGFQAINESDMLLMPDSTSAFVDPCLEVPTLSLTCDIVDPITGARYSRDPPQPHLRELFRGGSTKRGEVQQNLGYILIPRDHPSVKERVP